MLRHFWDSEFVGTSEGPGEALAMLVARPARRPVEAVVDVVPFRLAHSEKYGQQERAKDAKMDV